MSMVMGSPGVPRGPVHAGGVTGAASGGAVVANGVAGYAAGSDSSPFFRRARRARMAERGSRSRNLPCGSPELAWPYAAMRKASARP